MDEVAATFDRYRVYRTAVRHTEQIEVSHSLLLPGRTIVGDINGKDFIAKVESSNNPNGIKGGKVTRLHLGAEDDFEPPVAIFQDGHWLVEPPETEQALVGFLISYLNAIRLGHDLALANLGKESTKKTLTKIRISQHDKQTPVSIPVNV